MSEDKTYQMDEDCTIEDHRPCELKTAFGFTEDIFKQEGIHPPDSLKALKNKGEFSEKDLKNALIDAKNAMPEDSKWEIDTIFKTTFPQGGHINEGNGK